MIVHQEHEHSSAPTADLESAADFVRQHGGAIDVLADVFCTSRVMKNQCQI